MLVNQVKEDQQKGQMSHGIRYDAAPSKKSQQREWVEKELGERRQNHYVVGRRRPMRTLQHGLWMWVGEQALL